MVWKYLTKEQILLPHPEPHNFVIFLKIDYIFEKMLIRFKSINYGDNNSEIQKQTSIFDTFCNNFHPKNFTVVFQIFAIPHGGAETAHFSISIVRAKIMNLTTWTFYWVIRLELIVLHRFHIIDMG